MSDNDKGLSSKNRTKKSLELQIGWILDDMAREGPLRIGHLSKDPKEVRKGSMQISGGRVGLANCLFGLSKNTFLWHEIFL